MAKILTDKEMGQIIYDATHDAGVIDCSDAYEHFLEDLGELLCAHFGGIRGNVGAPDGELGWTCGFHVNECVPSDGGVFAGYDPDVTWKNGEEVQV
jgi:hypothetical protein